MSDATEATGQQTAQTEGTPSEAGAERPAWLPEKFNTPEEMATGYNELESKQSKAEDGKNEEPKAEDGETEDTDLNDVSYSVPGVEAEQLETYFGEFAENGKLSDASYSKLNEAGYDRNMVNQYIKGATTEAGSEGYTSEQEESFVGLAGGEAEYDKLMKWAGSPEGFSTEDQSTYNALMDTHNPNIAKHAVNWLMEQRARVEGKEPTLTHGAAEKGTSVQAFQSSKEMTAAMRDPRYRKDAAYNASVQQRINVSKL